MRARETPSCLFSRLCFLVVSIHILGRRQHREKFFVICRCNICKNTLFTDGFYNYPAADTYSEVENGVFADYNCLDDVKFNNYGASIGVYESLPSCIMYQTRGTNSSNVVPQRNKGESCGVGDHTILFICDPYP